MSNVSVENSLTFMFHPSFLINSSENTGKLSLFDNSDELFYLVIDAISKTVSFTKDNVNVIYDMMNHAFEI